MEKEIRTYVFETLDCDWWDEDNGEKFVKEGVKIINKGFSLDETQEILLNLYSAMKDEYGD